MFERERVGEIVRGCEEVAIRVKNVGAVGDSKEKRDR